MYWTIPKDVIRYIIGGVNMSLFILAVILVGLFGAAIPYLFRASLSNRLQSYLENKNYEDALRLLDSKSASIFMSSFDRNKSKLQIAMDIDDQQKIKEQVIALSSPSYKGRQRDLLIRSLYYFYLDKEDKEMATFLLTQMKSWMPADDTAMDDVFYRVVLEQKAQDIDIVQEKIDARPEDPIELGLLYYLLGLQYKYQGNQKDANQALNKAKRELKGTPYAKKIKSLMG